MIDKAQLDRMTESELLTLNQEVVALIKHKRALAAAVKRSQLKVGQAVQFTRKTGEVVRMVISKINLATISGDDMDKVMRWRVPVGMVAPLVSADAPSGRGDEVASW